MKRVVCTVTWDEIRCTAHHTVRHRCLRTEGHHGEHVARCGWGMLDDTGHPPRQMLLGRAKGAP